MSTAIIEDMKRTDHKVSKPAGDGNGTYSGKGKKVEKAGMAGKKAVTPPKSSVSAKAGEEKALVKKAASAKGKKIPATAGKGGKEASLSKTVEKSRIDQKVNPYRSNRLQRKTKECEETGN